MIPCLFKRATMLSYPGQTMPTGQGEGALFDCISCTVLQEKNGELSLSMEYPIGGRLWSRIALGDFIAAKANADETLPRQFFQIRSISRGIGETVKIEADHISYELASVFIRLSGDSITSIISALNNGETMPSVQGKYLFAANIVNAGNWTQETPISVRSLMVGNSSIPVWTKALSSWRDLVWQLDNRTITLFDYGDPDPAAAQLINNRGVKIAYGKNIVKLGQSLSADGVISGYYPYYWKDPYFVEGDPDQVTGDTIVYFDRQDNVMKRIEPLNLTSEFNSTPTRSDVTQACRKYMNAHKQQPPQNSLNIDYIDLAKTTEYSYLKSEKILVCDKVGVYYEDFGIDDVREVTALTYDVLNERNESITIGDRQASLADTILRYGGKIV